MAATASSLFQNGLSRADARHVATVIPFTSTLSPLPLLPLVVLQSQRLNLK